MKFVIEKSLDGLGRVVLPKSMRDYYGISANDVVRLTPVENGILITRAEEAHADTTTKGESAEEREV